MKKKTEIKKEPTKGFKVTNPDMRCRGFQYELNKLFTHSSNISMCNDGFHYCPIAADCFGYYTFDSSNRVFEILDHGTKTIIQGDKNCTDAIEFIRELTWLEVLAICNMGKDNTGISNTGYSNTGDRNTGISNTGDSNTGYRNTGYSNTGDRNTGNWNTGDCNTGYRNTGDRNTGNWNTGDRNTGDSNTGYRNTGAFCTDNNPMVLLFDKKTTMTVREWEQHPAFNIMANYLNVNIWVYASEMTQDEKVKYPSYKTAEGFLKSIPPHEAWTNMWGNLSESNKKVFLSLPNFDKKKFKEITGISV